MKKIFLFVLLACIGGIVEAQSCDHYLFLQDGKTIEMTVYNRRGKTTGVNTYTVNEVRSSGGKRTGNITMVMADNKGKESASATTQFTCSGDTYTIDMASFIPAGQMEQMKDLESKGDFTLSYPSNMKPGDTLEDGEMTMEAVTSGIRAEIEMKITDRKVVDKETVTTTAGSWECMKITSKMNMRVRMAGIGIPVNMESTEWFAPGVGIVQTESKHGKTAITAIR
ncbi:MAG: TapB family protein [Cecembia sp.]